MFFVCNNLVCSCSIVLLGIMVACSRCDGPEEQQRPWAAATLIACGVCLGVVGEDDPPHLPVAFYSTHKVFLIAYQ